MKGGSFTVKGLFNDKIDYVRRRMAKPLAVLPYVNPYKKEWVEGVRNSAMIDTPADPEAGLPEHEKKSYLQQLITPGFDNSTTGGSRGKSVISEPQVVELTNKLYRHLGLENVKSRGGRGGEGAVGHKLHFQGTELSLGLGDETALQEAQAVLRGLKDKATGKIALRINRDLGRINKALAGGFGYTPVLVGGGAGGGAVEAVEAVAEESSSEDESPAPAPAPAPVVYSLEAGQPNSLHSMTYLQLVPIARGLGIDMSKYPNEKGIAKALKRAIIASQTPQ